MSNTYINTFSYLLLNIIYIYIYNILDIIRAEYEPID